MTDAPLGPALGAPVSGTEGTALTAIVATFADADPQETATDYTASIDWGDGTSGLGTVIFVGILTAGFDNPQSLTFSVYGTHTYKEEGTYSIDRSGNTTAGTTIDSATSPLVIDPNCGSLTHGPVLPVSALHGTRRAFRVTHDGVSDWSNHFLYLCLG